jgi:predicted RNA binding protein YcfA (HicA-like mRNA interferase family)
MVSDEPTRKMLRELRKAGWSVLRNNGRHEMWGCTCGKHSVAVPASHNTISAGVVRSIRTAIAQCQEAQK